MKACKSVKLAPATVNCAGLRIGGNEMYCLDQHQRGGILQQDRHADGGDQRRKPWCAPQRPVGDAFDRHPERHADCHGSQRRSANRERRRHDGAETAPANTVSATSAPTITRSPCAN